ncbi:DNA recombination protein RmuC [Candidatus Omnitrophota bacterium]
MIWLAGILFLGFAAAMIAIVLKISSQVNAQLNSMNNSIQEANKLIAQRLDSNTGVFGNIKEELGKLQATNTQVLEVSKNISSLQQLLRAPKFRGEMGETMLENILSEVLPKDHYTTQYRFKTQDSVDAVIKLGDRLVPVDAKFSLENFQKMLDVEEESQKNAFRKKFIQDVKNRIDEISSKYILPGENTYDFGLMYIPAENVYYEMIIKEDLLSYCISKKVIPVSPNTFYAYLQVICLGLKGLKIEENAKEILKNLGALSGEIKKFQDDFNKLGAHLVNARNKYDDSQKRFDRVQDKITNIQDSKRLESKPH